MTSSKFLNVLKNISPKPLHVIDASIPITKYTSLDLSKNNPDVQDVNVASSVEFSKYITSYLKKHSATVAFGGYNEVRTIYDRSTYFDVDNQNKRNIHLGMDFWCAAETPVLAPLDGTVHSFKNNRNYGDYGPTLILEHHSFEVNFFTLYGHLSLASIEDLNVGNTVTQGEQIATLGDATVNGDYPPHLHFQIIKDIQDYFGDYPGVSAKSDLPFYLENCPNPKFLLWG